MTATYRAPDTVPLGDGPLIVLETGETFDIAAILAKEETRPKQVLVHRIGGRYLLVADGFRNAYLVDGVKNPIIPLDAPAANVAIKTKVTSHCAAVSYDGPRVLFVADSGKTSFDECPDDPEEAR